MKKLARQLRKSQEFTLPTKINPNLDDYRPMDTQGFFNFLCLPSYDFRNHSLYLIPNLTLWFLGHSQNTNGFRYSDAMDFLVIIICILLAFVDAKP